MKKRKLWLSVVAGALALVMLTGLMMDSLPTVATAASSSALKEQLDALEKEKDKLTSQIKDLQNQLKDNMGEMEKLSTEKSVIDQEIFLLHQQVTNINDQIATYSLMIADKQTELEKAEARLEELNQKNKDRIRAMEEDGNLSYWSVLFKANSFSDFLDRLNMVQEIAAADRRRLQEMRDAADVVAAAKAELEGQKSELEETKAELNATQLSLEAKQVKTDELLQQLIAKGEEFDKLLDASEEKQDQLMSDIANKKDEYEDAKYKEWLATSVPPTTKPVSKPNVGGAANTVNGITWLTPTTYVYMSSPFGMRWHPVYGGYRMHNGVDLAAYQGTPIVATRSGYVTTAAYEAGGAGYYVYINHGDGFGSIYMHMTHYIVRYGQYVTAGEVIGYVGSTGGSTGPHLHFGISYNGTYVNPANYIKIK